MSSGKQKFHATPVARLETNAQSAHRIAALFAETFSTADVATSLVDSGNGRWRVALHFRVAPDPSSARALVAAAAGEAAAATLVFELAPAKDWVSESLAGLQPVEAGRFVVHGAHDRARLPQHRIGIEIEAASAFGTGHHGTTRGCLLALDLLCRPLRKPRPRLARRRRPFSGRNLHILDLGTGSGVLAIAAARALHRRVLATDVDREAVRVARANVRINRVGPLIDVVQADGVNAPPLRARAPFDLILANILLVPLQRLATPLARLTAPGGRLILSGILSSQANAARAAYRAFALERRIELGGWTTLVLRRLR